MVFSNLLSRFFSYLHKHIVMKKIYTFIAVACFLVLCPNLTDAQSVSGRVLDAETREPLEFAVARSLAGRGNAYTDAAGEFTFPYENTVRDTIEVSYVGYKPRKIAVKELLQESFKTILLTTNLNLPTIEVTVPVDFYGNSGSILSPRLSELQSIPALGGESDPLKGLAFLPGVSTGTEGTAGVHIRGGNANQTDLQIDGVRVLNINHIGGFLSAVPNFGIKKITVYKGGVPGKFGGRLSGVVDISLREGRKDKHAASTTLGTGLIRFGVEGPLGANSSYLVSGRIGYPTLIYGLFAKGNFKKREQGNLQNFNLGDLYGKYSFNKNGWLINISGFLSADWGFDQNDLSSQLDYDEFNWYNNAYALSVKKRVGLRSWVSYKASYLRYSSSSSVFNLARTSEGDTKSERTTGFVTNLWTSKLRAEHDIGKLLRLSEGVEVIRQANNSRFSLTSDNQQGMTSQSNETMQESTTLSGFVQTDVSLFAGRVEIMGAIRASRYFNGSSLGKIYWEPRARVSLKVSDGLFVNGGYDANTQFDHQLRSNLSIFPDELWIQSDDFILPATSQQVYAGIGGKIGSTNTVQWSVEVFTKNMDGLARVLPGRESEVRFSDQLSSDIVANDGDGRVKGLEVFLRKTTGRNQFWLAYTLSKSERKFANVNFGDWFDFTFDRTHDLSLRWKRSLNERWSVSGSFNFQTGIAFTAPVATAADFDIYTGFNNARYPPFHLLNLGAEKRWKGKKRRNHEHVLGFSLYNAYNRANAYSIEVRPDREVRIDPITGQERLFVSKKVFTRSLLPIIPGISYRRNF